MMLKSAIEDTFGRDAWYALKESNHIPTWRKYAEKVLKAVKLSIHDTVEICDDDWLKEIDREIDKGLESIRRCREIDEIVADMAATLLRISFLQVGLVPRRKGKPGPFRLRKGQWNLSAFRSAVYLQTKEQKERAFWSAQQRRIGFDKQTALYSEWRSSGRGLSYVEWCKENHAEDQ